MVFEQEEISFLCRDGRAAALTAVAATVIRFSVELPTIVIVTSGDDILKEHIH